MLGREAKTKGDHQRAEQRVEGSPNCWTAQNVARLGHGNGVTRQPGEGERAKDKPKQQKGEECRATVGCELWEQTDEENRHFRIAEIADETLPECGRWRESPCRPR